MRFSGTIFFALLQFLQALSVPAQRPLERPFGALVCTPAPSGMVGWYPGDGNTIDYSSVHNSASLINGATFAPGMVQQAFSLDGVNDFVQAPYNAQQDLTTAATLDAWVFFNQKPSVAGRHMEIISRGTFGDDFDLGALTDDRFYLYIRGGINVGSSTVIAAGVWYHVAGTWDSTGLRMYVNGTLENTNSIMNVTRTNSTQVLTIGNGTEFDRNNRWFSGLIDEAEIINRALSAAEVAAIFNAGSAGKCKVPPTAAAVKLSGRVVDARGYAISRAVVFLQDGAATHQALTNPFGYYEFPDLTAGGVYFISVSARGFSFKQNPKVVTLLDNVDAVDFVAGK